MKPQTLLLLLMAWKIPSTAVQLYLTSLIATVGSSQDPWLNLHSIAHMGAVGATLRGIDALLDMTFGRMVHGNTEADKVIMNANKAATVLFIAAITIGLLTGCGTTFEQRVPYYKAVVNFGIAGITNGTATNLVGTLRALESGKVCEAEEEKAEEKDFTLATNRVTQHREDHDNGTRLGVRYDCATAPGQVWAIDVSEDLRNWFVPGNFERTPTNVTCWVPINHADGQVDPQWFARARRLR